MQSKKIVILGTGGTIAGRASSTSDNIGYTAAQVGVEQLVEAIDALATADNLILEQVGQIDSKDMTFDVWSHLLERVAHYLARDDVCAVVITHGTDTIEETAYFLQAVLNPDKPVVLTCAMRPATALVPDGPQNVMDALAVAACDGARGVVVVCAGAVHSAFDVQKVHTYRLDAFASGDAGTLGYVEEGKVRLLRKWPAAIESTGSLAIKNIVRMVPGVDWPQVEIVMNYAGANGAVVRALTGSGVKGLVLAGTGNGTVHHLLEAALLSAQASGIRVVRATRCVNGHVLPNAVDAFEHSNGLSPVKARIALILELMVAESR